MFDKLRSFVRGVIRRMFPAKNIKEALNLDTCVSDEMLDRMNLWAAMYRGVAPWCKDPVVRVMSEQIRTQGIRMSALCNMTALPIPATIGRLKTELSGRRGIAGRKSMLYRGRSRMMGHREYIMLENT